MKYTVHVNVDVVQFCGGNRHQGLRVVLPEPCIKTRNSHCVQAQPVSAVSAATVSGEWICPLLQQHRSPRTKQKSTRTVNRYGFRTEVAKVIY